MRMRDAPHASQCVLHFDLSNLLICMAFDIFEELAFGGDDFFEGGFEVGLGSGGIGAYAG